MLVASRPQVWDHIFLGKPAPANSAVPPELLAKMQREFEYWYPFDLRVSGKVCVCVCLCGATGNRERGNAQKVKGEEEWATWRVVQDGGIFHCELGYSLDLKGKPAASSPCLFVSCYDC